MTEHALSGERALLGGCAERLVPEPAKDPVSGGPPELDRSPFERDRARVLHSAAFRRLAAKTQIHTAGLVGVDGAAVSLAGVGGLAAAEGDFPRTRLTHSLEVAQIAREIGARLGCDPDVVDTAGLAHDLGHPPFGHNGEAALDAAAGSCGGFEGNAQTLRVLTRLEAKVNRPDGGSAGLNLTRASLDAATKYPWPRRPGQRKFGVYADDAPVFDWLRAGSPAGEPDRRCLEAQVMDWADDVAYSVHDVEDGVHGGYVDLARLRADPDERSALCLDVAGQYSSESPADLETVLRELLADPLFADLAGYDGSHRAQIGLKRVTSVLTGRFVTAAVSATRAVAGPAPLRRYAADLVVPRLTRAQCALLKGVALRYVMRRPGADAIRTRQRELLSGLVAALSATAPDHLDPVFAPLWRDAADDATRLRVVIDQVASLTDHAAVILSARMDAWRHS